jgi:hypothetical protein
VIAPTVSPASPLPINSPQNPNNGLVNILIQFLLQIIQFFLLFFR